MPGANPLEAVENYLNPIRDTLSCITASAITNHGGNFIAAQPHKVTFDAKPPIADLFGTALRLFVSQQYSIVQRERRKPLFKVKTQGYAYRLDDEQGEEILAYHWHPLPNPQDPVTYPHLHFNRAAQIGRRELRSGHIPSGRIALESLALYLIEVWGVNSERTDWREVLERNLENFEQYKSW